MAIGAINAEYYAVSYMHPYLKWLAWSSFLFTQQRNIASQISSSDLGNSVRPANGYKLYMISIQT